MPARGSIKPGSLSARVLAVIEASEKPMNRGALLQPLGRPDRMWLGRTLDRLVTLGHVRETRAGFVWTGRPEPEPKPIAERDPERLAPGQRAAVMAVISRAHGYRAAGLPIAAAELLERAAVRRLPPHVQQDLGALASLFAEHRQTFPEADLGRAAA